jgi:hypothetical protein
MSASFGDVGRLQLAGYASAATGILRSRIHPLVPVAAIDVLAVALALGAMNIVGTMVGGYRENPFIGDIGRTKDDLALFAVVAPEPPPSDRISKVAPTAIALAAVPDVELLFAAPILIGGPFEGGQGDTVRFVSLEGGSGSSGPAAGADQPPPSVVAESEDPTSPIPIPDASDDPSSPPLAKILSIAGRTQARAVELASRVAEPIIKAADRSANLVPLQKYSSNNAAGGTTAKATVVTVAAPVTATVAAAPPVASAATTAVAAVAAPVQAVAAPVQAVTAPVQQVAQTVTQPVTKAVSAIGGLLN